MRVRTGLICLFFVAGCGGDIRPRIDAYFADLSTTEDLAGADLAGVDLARTPDMVKPGDLAGADLTMAPDLTMAADMAVPVDMAVRSDGQLPGDGASGDGSVVIVDSGAPDMVAVVDAAIVDLSSSDLAKPSDLAQTPDMAAAGPALLVLHIGDGAAALSSAATPATVRKYKTDGSELKIDSFPLALPVAANGMQAAVTVSGSSTAEGGLSLTGDGRYAVVVGYDATVGTLAVAGTKSMATNRVVGRIDKLGNIDSSTRFNTAFDGANIRSAASDDGTRFWAAGSTNGIQFIKAGVTDPGTQILALPTNLRFANVFGGQLYVTSGTANYTTVLAVGTGLPIVAGQVAGIGMGLTIVNQSPYGFAALDLDAMVNGIDTLYIADDRTAANGGGIQKWTYDGAKWTLVTTLNGGLTTGERGLAAIVTNKVVTLYATTTEANANTLISIVDQGMAPMATVLATAPMNTVFRGVCVAPN